MPLIDMEKREVICKTVYYGHPMGGKTTNLLYIHQIVKPEDVGDLVSIDTETERTFYFDLIPQELGRVHGFQVRFRLSTRPGAILYDHHRIATLEGADCIIFVVDSHPSRLEENIKLWNEIQEHLRQRNEDIARFPLVFQWNKRDLPREEVLPLGVLQKYLNPYRLPSFEAVACMGQGVIECLRVGINTMLRRLPRVV